MDGMPPVGGILIMGRDDELARVLDKLLLFIYSLIILAASFAASMHAISVYVRT